MDVTPSTEKRQNLEQFRHMLFHLQMECGSIHQLYQHLEQAHHTEHLDELKKIDPGLMPQLLAREYVLEARKAESAEHARKYLETALSLDPYCPEACMELAKLSDTAESAMMWYQKSMDATTAILGEKRLAELIEEFKINPWRQVETHNYFKAKVSLAERLYRSAYYDVAIFHFQEMVAFNPADDLELRHYLMAALICENRLEDALSLQRQYPDDWSAKWYFLRAFLRFKQEGNTRRSRRALEKAFRRNLWVPVYLLGLEELPPLRLMKKRTTSPFRVGSRREAADCVKCIGPAFCEDAKLVWWVWEVLKTVAVEEVGE